MKDKNNKHKDPVNNNKEEALTPEEILSGEEPMISIKESEYKKLGQELTEYKDKNLRLCAEFDNARKRMDREKLDFVRYANQELLADFLDILDDLERSVEAAKANHEDYDAFLKGIEMVMAHVYDLLKKNDVKPIEAKGKMFDPHCHEALLQEERDDVEEGTIVDEFQKGYMIGDRVIRTNKVKVAKKKDNNIKDNQKN